MTVINLLLDNKTQLQLMIRTTQFNTTVWVIGKVHFCMFKATNEMVRISNVT